MKVHSHKLFVDIINVGLGNAAIIKASNKVILIDSGNVNRNEYLVKKLKKDSISNIDIGIITHPHINNYGGFNNLLDKNITFSKIWDSGIPTNNKSYINLLKKFYFNKIPLEIIRKDHKLKINSNVKIKVLSPNDPLQKDTFEDINNSSLVIKISYENTSFIFSSDIGEATIKKILSNNDLKADVLVLPNSISFSKVSKEYLKKINPKYIVISSNENNLFNIHQESYPYEVLKTFEHGSIFFESDGKNINVRFDKKLINDAFFKKKVNLNKLKPEYLELIPGLSLFETKIILKQLPLKEYKQLERTISEDKLVILKKYTYLPKEIKKFESKKLKSIAINRSINNKININTANLNQLIKLSGIGKKTALKIIKGRPYRKVGDLIKVKGIGIKKLNKLRGYISTN